MGFFLSTLVVTWPANILFQVFAHPLSIWGRKGLPLCEAKDRGVHCFTWKLLHIGEEKKSYGDTSNLQLQVPG